MIEVHPGLFVGADADALVAASEAGWYVIHAAKEPWHRAALGYTSKGAPKGHPEYLFAYRDGSLALNLVDAPDPDWIAKEAVMAGVAAILDNIGKAKVLVHCNQGASRSPMIALLYLCLHTAAYDDCDYDEAVERFRAIYPAFAPNAGVAGYLRRVFEGGDPFPSGVIDAPTAEIEHDIPEREEPRRPASRAIFKL